MIIHYDLTNSWATQDISNDFISAPIFTDTGDGTVNSAIIKLDATGGHYIRDARIGETGFPTKIDIFDRISITVLDGGGGSYQKYFDVMKKKSLKNESQGTVLQLELIGIEGCLQRVNYSCRSFLLNARELLTDLVDTYNANRTSKMPTLTIGTNELPPIFCNLDWGANEDTIYNRLMDLANAMGASTSNGGVLDYFDVRFGMTLNALTLNIFSSGDVTGGKPSVTLENSGNIIMESDGTLDNPSGSVVTAWGANDAGSIPMEWCKFKSKRILLPANHQSLFPDWKSDYAYPTNSIVKYKTTTLYDTWKRTSASLSTLSAVPSVVNGWIKLTPAIYYGNDTQYSPWTKGNNLYWKNSGADPAGGGTSPYGPCMWDGNIIINDDTTFRTWVDVKINSPLNISQFCLYGASSAGVYDGLRALVNGTGAGDFSGYNNYIMEYLDGAWRPKYPPEDNLLVACFADARVYKYSGGSWSDISSQGNALDCFHPMDGGTTSNSTSAFIDSDTKAEFSGNTNSSVKVSYTWTPLDDWTTVFGGTTIDYYKSGAWLSLRFPLPINTYNYTVGTHVIGEAYGGTAVIKQPTTVDIQNMMFTHDGKRGFNWGNSSEDLGPISSIDFTMKLWFSLISGINTRTIDKGDFQMKCACIDSNDSVAYQDFVIGFNNNWETISLPISGFQVTRNLRPRVVSFSDMTPPKAVDVSYQFEWRHLKMITFQTNESYDDNGRYNAGNKDFGVQRLVTTVGGLPVIGDSFKIELQLDAFRFTKPLLVNSGNVTGSDTIPLLIEADFLQRPDIFIYDQLKNDVLSELERARFPPEEYIINTDGEFNIQYGDFFLYTDSEIIDRSDVDPNKIKLVAKSIEYSITKPVDGNGGFQRNIKGVRRFV